MGMVVLAESLNVKDTQGCSQHNNMISGSYGIFATWVPLGQIETASIGDDSGCSRSKNDPYGGGYMFWTNRARIRWGQIDQASRCEVAGGCRRRNKSTPEARKQDMPPHFFKS
eukprot:scaffold51024_cov32-Attheya_sp.AAC.1